MVFRVFSPFLISHPTIFLLLFVRMQIATLANMIVPKIYNGGGTAEQAALAKAVEVAVVKKNQM